MKPWSHGLRFQSLSLFSVSDTVKFFTNCYVVNRDWNLLRNITSATGEYRVSVSRVTGLSHLYSIYPQVHTQHFLYSFCISVHRSSIILNAVLICIGCQSLNHVFWDSVWRKFASSVTAGPEKSVLRILFLPTISVTGLDVFIWLGLNVGWALSRFLFFFLHTQSSLSDSSSLASLSSNSLSFLDDTNHILHGVPRISPCWW